MIQEPLSTPCLPQTEYKFQLDVDIKITDQRPLFQSEGKIIYEVSWINPRDPRIVLLQINGPTADQEASFYIRFSDHPNIVTTFGRVRNNSNAVMLLQERSPKPDLSEMLREDKFKPTESVLCKIFEQVCDAMMLLARNGFVHGDLGCRNVLVFQSNPTEPKKILVKLTDFGLTRDSVIANSANSSMTTIPVRYAAPEILRNLDRSKCSEKCDVYSMGVLMWEALSLGELPYSLLDDDDVRQRKLNDERLPRPPLCGDQLWTIINQCWHQKPKHRPSFEKLKQRLSNIDFQSTLQLNQQSKANRTFQSPFPLLSPITRNSSNHAKTNGSLQSPVTIIQPRSNRTPSQAIVINDEFSNRKTRPIPCQFCQEIFPSSVDLHEHLILCGNKTEQCQTCHQFVRRAIFNYHTENNCAIPDESNTASNRSRIRLAHLSSRNSNRETFEMNKINVENEENQIIQNTSNCSMRPNVRIRTSISNSRVSPITVECERCHNRVAQIHYQTHKNNCLQNLDRVNNRIRRPQPLKSNRHQVRLPINDCNVPSTLVYIPCEICGRSIEGSNYSTHIEDCREQDKRRIENRAQRMSGQPAVGPIPCEYCQITYPANQISSHQANCLQNPRIITPIRNPIRQRYPSLSPIPPIIRSELDENSVVSPLISSFHPQSPMFNPTRLTYPREPADRINNERNRRNSMRNNPPNQSRERRYSKDTLPLASRNTSRTDFTYESITEHHLYNEQVTTFRSNGVTISVNEQVGSRTTAIRSRLSYGNFQNSNNNHFYNGLKLNGNVNYNEFRRKSERTRSRRRRSGHTRMRNKNNIDESDQFDIIN